MAGTAQPLPQAALVVAEVRGKAEAEEGERATSRRVAGGGRRRKASAGQREREDHAFDPCVLDDDDESVREDSASIRRP